MSVQGCDEAKLAMPELLRNDEKLPTHPQPAAASAWVPRCARVDVLAMHRRDSFRAELVGESPRGP